MKHGVVIEFRCLDKEHHPVSGCSYYYIKANFCFCEYILALHDNPCRLVLIGRRRGALDKRKTIDRILDLLSISGVVEDQVRDDGSVFFVVVVVVG